MTATTPASGFSSVEEAQAHFDSRAQLYNDKNVDAILAGIEDNAEIHYGDQPVTYKKKDFEPIIRARFDSYTKYSLKKTVRMVQGNMVVTDLDITWASAATNGEERRNRALEIVTFNGKKIAKWELVSCPRPINLP